MKDYAQLFRDIEGIKIAIVGDVMLDTYWWGKVDRISPEAPVPVIAISQKEERIGGAGNVALNTAGLKADTTLFSVVGNDLDADILINLFQQHNIHTQYIVKDASRPTTNKIRIMGRNQQMMRIDNESIQYISAEIEAILIQNFTEYVQAQQPQVVILEDYNKGVLSEKLISAIVDICKKNNIITAVDPKSKNFFSYKNVDIFKPNRKEVDEALHEIGQAENLDTLENTHKILQQYLQHKISLITLSEKGVFVANEAESKTIPGYIRNIADVSGAGDTVISVMSLLYAVTRDYELSAHIANIAGGLVCEEVGTAVLQKQKLIDECHLLEP